MTTSNAAVDSNTKAATDKSHEKLAEKRRALGRGLESLLPGPRALATPAPDSSQFPVLGSQRTGPSVSTDSSAEIPGGRPGTAVAARAVVELQAGAEGEGEYVLELALDKILQNPHQTRLEFDPKAINDLAVSIQTQGVLQPIVVRPFFRHTPDRSGAPLTVAVSEGQERPDGEQLFILILGERRFRASKIAGRTTIPAIVKRVSEVQAAEMTLVENLQRQDLDCLEQAAAFANLSENFKLTQEEIGKRVGVSREQVSNYIRLLKLPEEVLLALRKKELTYTHARLLLSLGDASQITKVARVVIAKKMSVALLEELVMDSHVSKASAGEPKEARWVDPNVRAEQRSLEAVLGMRVRIRDRKGKGKITIEYGSLEDFDRVVTMLKGN